MASASSGMALSMRSAPAIRATVTSSARQVDLSQTRARSPVRLVVVQHIQMIYMIYMCAPRGVESGWPLQLREIVPARGGSAFSGEIGGSRGCDGALAS